MKKIYFLLLVFLLIATTSFAEDLYIAQTAAGNNNMSSCSNAQSVSWLNTTGNWGAGAGKVSAGDTVHLCGTITSEVISLSAGVTLIGMSIQGLSYVTVDGGTNGIIEWTDNGTTLTYQLVPTAILISGSNK